MKIVALVFWMIASLYFCIGGLTSIIIVEKSEEAQKLPLFKDTGLKDKNNDWVRNIPALEANEDYEKMASFYPMYQFCGDTFSYIITLISFGVLGTVVKILISITFGKKGLEENNLYTLPLLGGLLGLLVLVLSELLPEFKYKSGNDKLFYSAAFLGGLYTKEFFTWLEKKFTKMLQSNQAK
jgi:hypothetical protein